MLIHMYQVTLQGVLVATFPNPHQQPMTIQMVPNKATACRTSKQSYDRIHIINAQYKYQRKGQKQKQNW